MKNNISNPNGLKTASIQFFDLYEKCSLLINNRFSHEKILVGFEYLKRFSQIIFQLNSFENIFIIFYTTLISIIRKNSTVHIYSTIISM
jgi:hypothetical protein